jgi:hypothetical protein
VARPRSLHASGPTRAADASRGEISARVETPQVEGGKLEPVKSETKSETRAEPAKTESAPELRRSTD